MLWTELAIAAIIIALVLVAVAFFTGRIGSSQMGNSDQMRFESSPDLATASLSPINLGPARRVDVEKSRIWDRHGRVMRGEPLTVPARHKPLWFMKGWRKSNGANEYAGSFTVGKREWRGLVKQPYGNRYETYIWDPPMSQLSSNTYHSVCFSSNGGGGRYKIHYSIEPASLDHAIASVEMLLEEAVGNRQRRKERVR